MKFCKYYFNNLTKLNELNISNNYFAKSIIELIIKNPDLLFDLYKFYKENIERNFHSFLSYELLLDLFKSSLTFNYKKDPPFNIDNKELSNYLLNTDRPLIKSFENDFIDYFNKIRRNHDLNNIDKINHQNNIKIRLNLLYEITRIYLDYNFIPLMKLYFIDEPIFPEDNEYFDAFLEKYCSLNNNYININNKKRN